MSGVEYNSCCSPIVVNSTNSMTIQEKMCYVISLLTETIEYVNTLQLAIDGLEPSANITNNRKLSETGNFTGTWFGEQYGALTQRILNSDFQGTWKGETKSSIDNRITFGDFLGTWEGENKTDIDNRITFGDFLGTWDSESKSSLDARIQDGALLYADVLALINSNPELNLEIIDGGYLASIVVPDNEDLGLVTEAITEEIDCGLVIYPCQCA